MATYSSAPAEEIVKYEFTQQNGNAFSNGDGGGGGSGPFNTSLFTVPDNCTYTILKSYNLNHSSDTVAAITGYRDTYKSGETSHTESVTTNFFHRVVIATGGSASGNLVHPSQFDSGGTRGEVISNVTIVAGQHVNSSTSNPIYAANGGLFLPGMQVFLQCDINFATPTSNEFSEFLIYFKKTTFFGA